MRSRKELLKELGLDLEAIKKVHMDLLQSAEDGKETGINAAIGSLVAQVGSLQVTNSCQLEVMLDIRDAVTTWIAGDLSARSTAQQYRNTATEAIVGLLQEQNRKITTLIQQGPRTP